MSINGTLHLDTDLSLKSKASSLQNLQLQSAHHRPKDQPLWFSELRRLQHLEDDFAFIPVGWGNEYKAPMFYGKKHLTTPEDWTEQALTIEQLIAWNRTPYLSVGARTGPYAGPLLAYDFDGSTSVDFGCGIGIEPWAFDTWHVHRDNDPWRLKVLCRPTPAQLAQLPVGADGSIEFQGKIHTKDAADGGKGEALEVFFHHGRQVVVVGEHRSSGGNYIWKPGIGPEDLAAPPQAWMDLAIQVATDCHNRVASSPSRSSTRSDTRRLDPCPICGRHSGRGGSALWCEQTAAGLILCMPGSTFSAEQKHGSLAIGQVVDGYALVKRSAIPEGDVLTFCDHKPLENASRHQRARRNLVRAQAGVTL